MRLKILIAEDDPLQAAVLARFFEAEGWYVDVAHDGREAISRIKIGIFDIVLLDYRMPEIDGLAVSRVIQALPEQRVHARLIALTSSPETLRARMAGTGAVFDAIEGKPVSLPSLLATVQRCHAAAPARSRVPVDAEDRMVYAALSTNQKDILLTHGAGEATDDPGSAPGRILLVDDDLSVRMLLQAAFEADGYLVDAAADGIQGLRLIMARTYDVAVIDFQMPELDGLATAKLVYTLLARHDRPRLVALTSAPNLMMETDSECGVLFDEIVAKSYGMPVVLAAVRRCFEYRELRLRHEPASIIPMQSIGRVVGSQA